MALQRSCYVWVLGIVIILVTSTAGADSLTERTEIRKAEERLRSEKLDGVKRKCGDDVGVVRVDWKSFEKHYTDNYKIPNATAYCGEALSALRAICEDSADGKTSVRAKLKNGMVCRYDGAAATLPKVSITGNAAVVSYDWKTPNLSLETKRALMKQL